MLWASTAELYALFLAGCAVSVGLVYTVVHYCRPTQKQENDNEALQQLRDDMQPETVAHQVKPQLLESPPFSKPLINPNYSSPQKVSTRHLRSTSGIHSPTHYLSPHPGRQSARRNSSPTQKIVYPTLPGSLNGNSASWSNQHQQPYYGAIPSQLNASSVPLESHSPCNRNQFAMINAPSTTGKRGSHHFTSGNVNERFQHHRPQLVKSPESGNTHRPPTSGSSLGSTPGSTPGTPASATGRNCITPIPEASCSYQQNCVEAK